MWNSNSTRVNVLGYFPALRGNAINQPHDASGGSMTGQKMDSVISDRQWWCGTVRTDQTLCDPPEPGQSGTLWTEWGEPEVRLEGVGLLLWCLRSVPVRPRPHRHGSGTWIQRFVNGSCRDPTRSIQLSRDPQQCEKNGSRQGIAIFIFSNNNNLYDNDYSVM